MEDRRKEDRRKLYGKPFLAMLMGVLPEDRRKSDRRVSRQPPSAVAPETLATVSGEFVAGGDVEAPR